jgi:hypothetical protein
MRGRKRDASRWARLLQTRALVVIAACSLVIGVVSIAYADHNTHTAFGIYHGVGDGTNFNGYVHDFLDVQNGENHYLSFTRFQDNNALGQRLCPSAQGYVCQHLHDDIYPSISECHENGSFRDDTIGLNPHRHYHHYYCGP